MSTAVWTVFFSFFLYTGYSLQSGTFFSNDGTFFVLNLNTYHDDIVSPQGDAMGTYGVWLIVILFFFACFLMDKRMSRQAERQKKKQYEHYRKLYESGEIYNSTDRLWHCLRWLAAHNKEILFTQIWEGMTPYRQRKIERMIKKERAKQEGYRDHRDSWQTSAYPEGEGDSGD